MGCDQSKPVPLVDDYPDGGASTNMSQRAFATNRSASIAHVNPKYEHATNEQAPVMNPNNNGGAGGGAALPPVSANHGATSTATPYNRAKDRVDAISESKTIICNGVKMQYAYVSQRGFYPEEPFKANQDA